MSPGFHRDALVPRHCRSFVWRGSVSSRCVQSKPVRSPCAPVLDTLLHFLYNVFHFAKLKFRTFFTSKPAHEEDLFSVVLNIIWIYVRVVLPSGVFVAFVTIGSVNGNSCYLLCPNSVWCFICIISFNAHKHLTK